MCSAAFHFKGLKGARRQLWGLFTDASGQADHPHFSLIRRFERVLDHYEVVHPSDDEKYKDEDDDDDADWVRIKAASEAAAKTKKEDKDEVCLC